MSPTDPNMFKRGITLKGVHERIQKSNLLMKVGQVKVGQAQQVKLNLYYIKRNSYTKFQVNITKDSREKSGTLKFNKGQ